MKIIKQTISLKMTWKLSSWLILGYLRSFSWSTDRLFGWPLKETSGFDLHTGVNKISEASVQRDQCNVYVQLFCRKLKGAGQCQPRLWTLRITSLVLCEMTASDDHSQIWHPMSQKGVILYFELTWWICSCTQAGAIGRRMGYKEKFHILVAFLLLW